MRRPHHHRETHAETSHEPERWTPRLRAVLPTRAAPDRVARDTLRGIAKDRARVYTPGFWRYVMLIIRFIPDRIFKRLDL